VGDDAWLAGLNESSDVVLGVGYPRIRKAIIARLCGNAQLSFPNLIHPSVEVDSEWVRIGQGNVISNGCIFTCDISIRDYNFFNRSVTVGHDCTIGSYNVVNPGSNISGYVRLGDEILVGTGAQILARLGVASRTVIGAGAVVTRDIVEEEGVYVGMPARRR
jgi:sugar O-acyltransferase (sialic acid O-acetyltransferase NeuD family)